jgi:hypothetical protein|tara:strand:+ start:1737 stop:2252 length:516 start_codon:yes stop_codon:yes gene_type:complete
MNKAIKVRVLLDHKNDVFRDIDLAKTSSFESFHKEVLNAFNFPNNQMASFYLSNDEWDKGEEIPLTDMNEGEDKFIKTMEEVSLSDKLFKKGQKMVYVYDFLLMWCFFIEVIDVFETDTTLPKVSKIIGDAPDPMDKDPDIIFAVDDYSSDEEDEDEEDNEDEYGIYDEFN